LQATFVVPRAPIGLVGETAKKKKNPNQNTLPVRGIRTCRREEAPAGFKFLANWFVGKRRTWGRGSSREMVTRSGGGPTMAAGGSKGR